MTGSEIALVLLLPTLLMFIASFGEYEGDPNE